MGAVSQSARFICGSGILRDVFIAGLHWNILYSPPALLGGQAIQQGPQFRQGGNRRHGGSGIETCAGHRLCHPRRQSRYGAVRQLTKNVLASRESRSSAQSQVLTEQRMPAVMNPDRLRTMGIMFRARQARGKRIWLRGWVWKPAANANV